MIGAPVFEGRIHFRGHETWYRIVGDGDEPGKVPVVCLHGGPGAPSDYLEPLEGIVRSGRRAVFYDQIGCGNSALPAPQDPSFWSVDLFVDELSAIHGGLDLGPIHLLGQSWGGMLAMEVALTHPEWLSSLAILDSPASIPLWVAETGKLRARLPKDVQETLTRHEQAGTTSDPEYEEACMVFYRRHVCRLDPWPDCVSRTFEKLSHEVYESMNGPSEFHVTGSLREWSVVPQLGEIDVPAFVLTGEHDEATPPIAHTVHAGIKGAELVILEGASHMPHVEQTDRVLELLDAFWTKVER